MKRTVKLLSVIAALATLVSSLTGLFYTNGGGLRTVKNIYGQEIVLFGDGIYANNSILKVGATKGTDIVMVIVALLLLATIVVKNRNAYLNILRTGLLLCLLYPSTCLIMGVSFNRLFPLYLVQFSSALFAFILSLSSLLKQDCFKDEIYKKKLTGTAALLIIGGCSVLIWLAFIIPAVITGVPTGFIEIYTTEPTYAIDLGIILPSCVFCGVYLLKKKKQAYPLASVLMTFVTCVGLCVIAQTVVQLKLGIVINAGQLIGMVLSFVVLGLFAVRLNIKLLRYAKEA